MRTQKWVLILALALTAPAALASPQQKDPRVAPAPPVTPAENKPAAAAEPTPAAQDSSPDTRPLSGVQVFTLGRTSQSRNYLRPRFQVQQIGDNRPDASLTDTNWRSATVMQAGVSFQHIWKNYQFVAGYSGGGSVYVNGSGINQSFHTFGFAQSFDWRRWNLLIAEDFGYLPETSYFLGGGQFAWLADTGLAISGPVATTGTGLGPGLVPDQSIITGRASRFTNISVAQVQYRINPRSSFIAAGSYSLLKYRQPGFVNSSAAGFRAGYDRNLSPRDTIGLVYQLSMFRFNLANSPNNFDTHQVHLSYGRRLTGRLAWRVSGGPQIVRFRTSSSGAGDDTPIQLSVETSLTYALRRTSMGLFFTRGASGGSGVYTGAETNAVGFSVSRQLTRKWHGGASMGYARNSALRSATDPAGGITFDTWTAGGELSYAVSRYARIFGNYHMDRQTNNLGANLPFRHRFGIGLDFGFRPVRIE